MDNRTVINPNIIESAPTAINSELVQQYGNQIDSISRQEDLIDRGTIICDKYTIEERLEVASGEADLYICSNDGKKYIAKIYKRKFAIKEDVIKALLSINSPYVAKLHETAKHNGFPVEIIPYYKNGSLQGKTFNYEELVESIIPNINEGLHAIHQAGIIHKDLKPSNIMLNDDGKTVSIIDFGISSAVDDKHTLLVTKTGMTPEYSAPETFKNIFYEGSDYYSFGITLFELFCGYTPYANMQPEEIEQYVSVQRIPFPESMPVLLQDFISALTYYDISYRKNKNNPNRRWTYEEVVKWINGESLIIPGEGIGNVGKGNMPIYHFLNEEITSIEGLAASLAKNWNEGKKHLFRGLLSAHFRVFDQEAAKKCMEAEEEASRSNGKDDIIFWKLLYRLNPKLKGFYWKGEVYESLPAFGRDVLEKLWKHDKSQYKYYESVLNEKLLTQYVMQVSPKNEALKKATAAIEDSYVLEKGKHSDLLRTYYYMAYTLSGQKLLLLDNQQFRTVGELAGYMRECLDLSFDKFETLCHRLVDYDGNLDVQLETWLIAIGKKKEIDKWRMLMNE